MCFPRGQEALFIVTYNNIFPRANLLCAVGDHQYDSLLRQRLGRCFKSLPVSPVTSSSSHSHTPPLNAQFLNLHKAFLSYVL